MVKNTKGGKNQKRMGRKFVNAPRSNHLRTANPKEEAEMYACVSKCLGNGMAHAVNTRGIQILIHIRNKFSGRGKRDNTLEPGVVILAGARTFESIREGKIQNCDLLEVYSENDAKRLANETTADFDAFKQVPGFDIGGSSHRDREGAVASGEGFEFGQIRDTTIDEEIEAEVQEAIDTESHEGVETIVANSDVFDFNDI